jgi:hypothetical protein
MIPSLNGKKKNHKAKTIKIKFITVNVLKNNSHGSVAFLDLFFWVIFLLCMIKEQFLTLLRVFEEGWLILEVCFQSPRDRVSYI